MKKKSVEKRTRQWTLNLMKQQIRRRRPVFLSSITSETERNKLQLQLNTHKAKGYFILHHANPIKAL